MEENILQVLNTEYYHKYQVCPEGETPGGLSKRRMEGTGFLKAIDTIQNFYDKNPQWLPRTKDEAIILIKQVFEDARKGCVPEKMPRYIDIEEYLRDEFSTYKGPIFYTKSSEPETVAAEEFKPGEMVEVCDEQFNNIVLRTIFSGRFLCVTPSGLFAIEYEGEDESKDRFYVGGWKYCRRPKQTVEEWSKEWALTHHDAKAFLEGGEYLRLYYNERKSWEEQSK
ncbi:MAG: hypothetical protein A2W17_06745 [Planctomycetes bacterium RBG_16_41_13]|nr:MAG: hypothetical protein A2W17_06745 [Planctomycetes bacterium RBG_16_41_13]